MATIGAAISTLASAPPAAYQLNTSSMPLLKRVWQPRYRLIFSPVTTATTSMARPPPRRDLTWRASSSIVFSSPGVISENKTSTTAEPSLERGSNPTKVFNSVEESSAMNLYKAEESGEEEYEDEWGIEEYEDESEDGDSEYHSIQSQEAEQRLSPSSSADSLTEAVEHLDVEDRYPRLGYCLSESAIEAARSLQKLGDGPLYWSWRFYKLPKSPKEPESSKEQPVSRHYCKNKEQSEECAAKLLDEKLLGFDLEWKVAYLPGVRTFKEEVSTIQLASESRVVLFHVALHEGSTPEEVLPPSLKRILESTEYLKAGVNVRGDLNRLRKYWNLKPAGYFELSHLYKLVKYSETAPRQVNKRLVGLAQQVEEILGMPLAKDDVRVSDWSLDLKVEQVDYACSDAYAAVHLFHELNSRRMQLTDVPPLPDFVERDTPIKFTVRTDEGESLEVQSRDNSEAEGDHETETKGEDEGKSSDGDAVAIKGAVSKDVSKTSRSETSGSKSRRGVESSSVPSQPASAEVQASVSSARTWAKEYRQQRAESGQALRASNSQLVAYRLWHKQQFSLTDVATYMSARPLQMSTVSSYVLQCIRLEKLPFEKTRIDECLSNLPPHVAGGSRTGIYSSEVCLVR